MTEPTLLLDQNICKANIQRMAEKASANNLRFKPHMKTHQSAEIGEWLRDSGVEAITVSSIKMAEYFADHGWRDITIAFPCNIRQVDRIDSLAAKATITLLVNNLPAVEKLQKQLNNTVKAYIEIDTGSQRTGLSIDQLTEIKKIVKAIKKTSSISWVGFYSHPGHSYSARSAQEIREIHSSVIKQIHKLRDSLGSEFGSFEVCIGDTPCCSKGTNFEGIDAISPGNFVFYDLMQVQIGSCEVSDVAVAVSCPVVDRFPDRGELAIHGGAIHFSKESMDINGNYCYGLVVTKEDTQWEVEDSNSYLKSLSQEHGIIQCSKETFDKYQVGDFVTILPVHSCLTANLMKSYQLLDGKRVAMMQ